MILSKEQTEMYVIEIYKSIYKLTNYKVFKFESPDFIVWEKHHEKIGVEVTTASNTEQNELKNISNTDNREVLGKKFHYEKHKINGRVHDYGIEIESRESKGINKVILDNINCKFKKLNKNTLCCAPISSFLYNENDYENFAKELNELAQLYDILFNEIIVITYDTVIKYGIKDKKYYALESNIELPYDLSKQKQIEVSKNS